MKIAIAIMTLFALMLVSCRGTKFAYKTDAQMQEFTVKDSFQIDQTYSLYVRQIVRRFDSASRLYKPFNAMGIEDTDVVEIEYMLISFDSQRVIILNNIPSIYRGPYSQNKDKFNLVGTGKTITIDIWYFRQFRFGQLKPSNAEIDFSNAGGSDDDHRWNIEFGRDSMLVVCSIAVADEFGKNERNIEQAFAMPMLFKKVPSFDIVFQNKGIEDSIFTLANKTFYIASVEKKGYYVIFRFDDVIHGTDDKNVIFNGKRIYAFPFRKGSG